MNNTTTTSESANPEKVEGSKTQKSEDELDENFAVQRTAVPEENLNKLTEFNKINDESPVTTGPGFFSKWFRSKSPIGGSGGGEDHPSQPAAGQSGGPLLTSAANNLYMRETETDAGELKQQGRMEVDEKRKGFGGGESSSSGGDGDGLSQRSSSSITTKSNSLSLVTQKVSSLLLGMPSPDSSPVDPLTGKPLMNYEKSDFKQYWMPDYYSKECYECQEKFTTLRRRHHCRICGQIFCSKCCNKEIQGRALGYMGSLRLCNFCCEKVKGVVSESDAAGLSSNSYSSLKRRKMKKGGGSGSKKSFSTSMSYNAAVESTETIRSSSSTNSEHQQQHSATTIPSSSTLTRINSHLTLESPDFWPTKDSITASTTAESSLFSSSDGNNRPTSLSVHDLPAVDEHQNSILPPTYLQEQVNAVDQCGGPISDADLLPRNVFTEEIHEPDWVRSIQGSTTSVGDDGLSSLNSTREADEGCGNGDGGAAGLSPTKGRPRTSVDAVVIGKQPGMNTNNHSNPLLTAPLNNETKHNQGDTTTVAAGTDHADHQATAEPVVDKCVGVDSHSLPTALFDERAKQMIRWLMQWEALDAELWFPVIWPMVKEIAATVKPDIPIRKDDMDVLSYIHIKTFLASQSRHAKVVYGTVCSKTIGDERMASSILNPRILLLTGSVEYERVAGRLGTLDPIISQELEYMRNTVHKITSSNPDIVIVENTVARIAQSLLRNAGITLVYGMKSSVIRRIARCCQAELVPHIEGQIMKPVLGTCGHFKAEKIAKLDGTYKYILVFQDCPKNLSASVLLTGPNQQELDRVKRLIRYLIVSLYSNNLEMELMDAARICISSVRPGRDEQSCQQCVRNQRDYVHCHGKGTVLAVDDGLQISKSQHESDDKENEGSDLPIAKRELQKDSTDFGGEKKATAQSLKNMIDLAFLDTSPFLTHGLPYLETSASKFCPHSVYFRKTWKNLYPVRSIDDLKRLSNSPDWNQERASVLAAKQLVPPGFAEIKVTQPVKHPSAAKSVAAFRAKGGKLFKKHVRNGKNSLSVNTENANGASSSEDAQKSPAGKWKGNRVRRPSGGVTNVLSPYNHMRIAVLFTSFSSKSENAPGFCIDPWVVWMEFYGPHDLPLGDFLQRYCFNKDYMCPKREGKHCEVSMLEHTRKIVHRNACVEINSQPIMDEKASEVKQREGNHNNSKGGDTNSNILMWNWCSQCKGTSPAASVSPALWHLSFAKYLDYLFNGRALPSHLSGAGQEMICHHCAFHQHDHYFAYANYVASFKVTMINLYEINLSLMTCHIEPTTITVLSLVEESKVISEIAGGILTKMLEQTCSLKAPPDAAHFHQLFIELQAINEQAQEAFRDRNSGVQEILTGLKPVSTRILKSNEPVYLSIADGLNKSRQILSNAVVQWNTLISEWQNVKKQKTPSSFVPPAAAEAVSSPAVVLLQPQPPIEVKTVENKSSEKHSSTSGAGAADKEGDKNVVVGNDVSSSSSAAADDVTPVFDLPPAGLETSAAPATSPKVDLNIISQENPQSEPRAAATVSSLSSTSLIVPSTPSSGGLVSSKRNSTSKLLLVMPTELKTIQPAFTLNEHYCLPVGRFPVVIRDGEIGSILAYGLSSSEYETKQKALRVEAGYHDNPKKPFLKQAPNEPADMCSSTSPHHIELQFADQTSKYYIKAYYAEHFRKLREMLMEDGEDSFIRSLSRSDTWSPKGGKSGATFFRTQDKRFIMKTMSTFEIASFLKFAPQYFHYVSTAITADNKLTALAKVYGVYKICFRNELTSKAEKKDVFVMEYLFYRKKITHVYDLKGSLRNRLARNGNGNGQGTSGEWVDLDENLLLKSWHNPHYLHPHSKTVLTQAITNDSHFLSTHHVMDYSLLVGVSEDTKELTVGIIDYIRTYTLDKRMEYWVKSIAVPTTLPTVVSPEMYKTRFTEAIDIYFPVAPDQWSGLSQGLQC